MGPVWIRTGFCDKTHVMSLLIVSRIFVAVNDYPSGDILLGSKVCRDPGSRERELCWERKERAPIQTI